MNNPSKQEEFLERLKDPTKAKLNDAVAEFLAAHPGIEDIRIFKVPKDSTYYVEVYADNHGILLATSGIFRNTIKKHLDNTILVHERSHPDIDKPEQGLFRHSYFIDFSIKLAQAAPFASLEKHLAKAMADAIDKEIVKAFGLPKNLLPDND